MRFAYLFLLVYFYVLPAWAHGDLHARIQALSAQIGAVPEDLELYQQRGELLLQHEEFADARRDFEHCRRHGNESARLYYCLGKTYFQLKKFKRSQRYLHLSLEKQKTDTKSIRLLAMCHVAMHEFPEAIVKYSEWMQHAIRPRPAVFLELANVYFLSGDMDMCIHVLQRGISRLGMLPPLTTHLLGYYKMVQDYDAAIDLQTEVVTASARKEFALFERAMLFQTQNSQAAYQADLIAATAHIQRLPAHVRQGSMIKELIRKIEERMSKIESSIDD